MPDLTLLLAFAGACLILTATPGPDMALIAARSAAHGRFAGFATLAGIQAGTYGHALATGFGLAEVLRHVPLAFEVVRGLGVAYLLLLAVQAFRRAGAPGGPGGEDVRRQGGLACFRQGLFTNLLNPKMALFVLALFPQFLDPAGGSLVLQALLLATILNAVGLLVNGLVIVAADRLGAFARGRSRWRRVADRLLGAVFVALAARLALAPR